MIPEYILKPRPYLTKWAILSGWRGSVAHGMYLPPEDKAGIDDKDAMFICVPSLDNYIGLNEYGSRGTWEVYEGCWDIICYEALKFIRLLEKGNPNVLSMLWLPKHDYFTIKPAGKLILDNRDLFSSKNVYPSFIGYAHGQLHRMTHYNGRPPTELAYMAGIFDGEGHVCIRCTQPPKETWSPLYVLDVGITNTDHDLIQHLLDEYGGYAGRTGIRDGHRLDAYRWRVSGPMGAKFLKTVYPFLRIKKRQAEIGLAFQQSISQRKRRTLTQNDLAEREEFRLSLAASRQDKTTPIPDSCIEIEGLDNAYEEAYMGQKRKALVDEFGYDCKNAVHLIRLLRMGIEFLNDGQLYVERKDAKELLAIKRGEWTLKEVKEEADRLFALAKIAVQNSKLPEKVDSAKINKLAMQVIYTALEERQEWK